MLSFLVKLLHVIVTDVVIVNLEKQTGFLGFFLIKCGWKPLLTPLRTEVNEMLSHGSILEVKALRGFLHSQGVVV